MGEGNVIKNRNEHVQGLYNVDKEEWGAVNMSNFVFQRKASKEERRGSES